MSYRTVTPIIPTSNIRHMDATLSPQPFSLPTIQEMGASGPYIVCRKPRDGSLLLGGQISRASSGPGLDLLCRLVSLLLRLPGVYSEHACGFSGPASPNLEFP